MLIKAVEKRFGHVEGVPEAHALELLSDNGGAYIAYETRQIAGQLGLRPITTPVCSPQSNGMAESFVNTFKCDYVGRMDLTDARTVTLSDPAMSEALYDVPLFGEFAGLGWDSRLPDESTILRFHHLLERRKLAEQILVVVNDPLSSKGGNWKPRKSTPKTHLGKS